MKIPNIELLANFPDLFHQVGPQELQIVLQFIKRIKLNGNHYLFYEGTPGENIYLIKSGKMAVEAQGQHITYLLEGYYFGEISILDNKPRSTSVYATNVAELYALNMLRLQNEQPELYAKLIINLSKVLPERLRKTNDMVSSRLKNEIDLLKKQVQMGRFLVFILVIMATYIFVLRSLSGINQSIKMVNISNIRITLILACVFFVVMWKNGYQLKMMGLNFYNGKQAILESLMLSFLVIGSIMVIKWLFLSNFSAFKYTPLLLKANTDRSLLETCIGYIIFSPIQEFIARGCLQSSLMQFFEKDYSSYSAIIISNLIFCSFYASFSPTVPLTLFFLGLLWGWQYMRHQTLLGVSLSHALIGIYITGIIGLPIELV
jgi:CRP/FNR family transcriptional regulator, cyclic AMP receptor protein